MSWHRLAKQARPRAQEPKRDIPYEIPGQRLGPQLASEIARLFDDFHIPSFVWDWIEKSPWTETRNHLEFEFIIPDHLIIEAQKALATVGFISCAAESACHMFEEFPFKPLPTIHFHHISRVDEVISLRKQTALATKLPLTLAPPAPNDPDFMLSNEPRLSGSPAAFAPLPDIMYPFRLLAPVRFAEALVLQACQDVDVERETVIRGYMLRLGYLKQCGQGPTGLLDQEYFHEYLWPFWAALEQGAFQLMIAHARRLKDKLNRTGFRLPTAEELEQKKAKRRVQQMRNRGTTAS
ncbi:uncharacterized protein KD926_002320 [Aspergillus affinis]|uniref:uncharacterized protein n=1 Tax=Aspergillus affinis TaxID=1070780 RepID=UPI0022FE6792|nr:uncharacterized protein KD926_002320 [Aspergillus affinis]KAI9043941.1 hypothetical protein KD926_002320 [Aspergillus affinis]